MVQSTRRLTLKLIVSSLMMFAFALLVMPPLYDLFCEVTGLNGKTSSEAFIGEVEKDEQRLITVKFLASNNRGMPWQFQPEISSVDVHPGVPTQINYIASNPTNKAMIGQAIPSMVPANANNYFHKTECFCFNNQPLQAGETAKLGLVFIVDSDLPKGVNSLVLSYTMFDITDRADKGTAAAQQSPDQATLRLVSNNND